MNRRSQDNFPRALVIGRGSMVAAACVCGLLLMLCAPGCRRSASSTGSADQKVGTASYEKFYELANGAGTLSVRLDSTSASLIDGFTVRVRCEPGDDPAGIRVTLPDMNAALPDNWTAHRTAGSDSGAAGTQSVDVTMPAEWAWHIEPFIPGDFELGAFEIKYQIGDDGQESAVHTDPIGLIVQSMLYDDDTDAVPADIKGVLDAPLAWWQTWWFLTLLIAAVVVVPGVIMLTVWLLRRRLSGHGDDRGQQRLVPQVAAHEMALRRLRALLARDLMARGLVKQFYGELTWIMRQYIEDRFGLRAPDRTTEEFLDESRAAGIFSPQDLDLFDRFLGHCDLVKFAEAQPSGEQVQAVVGSIQTFVERTKSDAAQVADEGEPVQPAVAEGVG